MSGDNVFKELGKQNEEAFDITIFTLVYNSRNHLYQLFAGMCVQNRNIRVQWYIVDDVSSDGSNDLLRELIQTLPSNIVVSLIENEKHSGSLLCFEQVLENRILGRYCMLLEVYDCFKEGFLQNTIEFLDTHSDYAAVHTAYDHYFPEHDTFMYDSTICWDNQERKQVVVRFDQITEGHVYQDLLVKNFIRTCTFVARTEVYLKCMLPRTYVNLQFEYTFFDYPTNILISRQYKIGFINCSLAVYHVSFSQQENRISQNIFLRQRFKMMHTATHIQFDVMNERLLALCASN